MAGLFALVIGFVSLRRSGIYFSILTLAFAQMCYNLAYSVLTPITNGETGLQVRVDPRERGDLAARRRRPRHRPGARHPEIGVPITNLFGMKMSGYAGLLLLRRPADRLLLHRPCASPSSNFGMMLRAIKSNQNRLSYTGIHTRPYLITAFVISGMYAGLAGSLLAVTDPIAGAERMQWTASGEVVLMTILGGAGTLIGPVLGAGLIKYAEQKVSSWNDGILHSVFSLPAGPGRATVVVRLRSPVRRRRLAPDPGPPVHGDRDLPARRPDGRLPADRRALRTPDGCGSPGATPRIGGTGMPLAAASRRTGGVRLHGGIADMVLHIDDVHKSFAGLHALSDVDLDVREGETHAIIGPNGAGKSTLLNVCVGRLQAGPRARSCSTARR